MLRSGAGIAAPEVKWSAQLSENNKFNFLKIIGSSGDGFFVLRSNMSLDDERDHTLFKSRKYLLQFFNSNLVMLWEKELKYTSPDVHIVAVYCINEKALIFSYTNDKVKKDIIAYAQYINDRGEAEKDPVMLDDLETDNIDEDNKPGLIWSQDQQKIALAYRRFSDNNESQSYHVTVLDSSLNLVYRKEMLVPFSTKHFSGMKSILSNEGNFFILGVRYLTEKKIKAPGESFYQVIGYNHTTEQSVSAELKLENKFLTDVSASPDNINHRLVVAGFYSEQSTYGVRGIFYISLEEDSLRQSSLYNTPFNPLFLQKFAADRKNKNELVNYSIDRLVLRKDGGAVILAESFFQSNRTYWDYYSQSMVSHYYYHFGNVMVLSLNPDGNILWNNAIGKDQNSVDDGGYYASYAAAISGGRMFALYNKYIEENSSVLITAIDGQGHQKTDALFSENEHVTIMPRSSAQVDEETLIVPAMRENRFYFAKIIF